MNKKLITPEFPTTLSSWVLLINQTLNIYNFDGDSLLNEAGIDLSKIRDNTDRIPNHALGRFWDLAIAETNDHYFPLKVAKNYKPTAFSALGLSLIASRNIHDAIERFVKYSHLISDISLTYIEESDLEITIFLLPQADSKILPNKHGIEAIFATTTEALRSISSKKLTPSSISFTHNFELDIKPFEDFFNCPVIFSSRENSMKFNKKEIKKELILANSALTNTLDQWIESHLLELTNNLISTKVKRFLLLNFTKESMSLKRVAKELNHSTRSLQKKLLDEGTNYRELHIQCRHDLSKKLISEKKLSFSEIAYILGFNDQGSFSRAFKKNSGITAKHFKHN